MARAQSRGLINTIYAEFARIGKALASPHRIRLLDLLMQGSRTVEVLAGEAQLSIGSTSQHLQVLRGARLVQHERHGLFVRYALEEGVEGFVLHLRDLGRERLPGVEAARQAHVGQVDAAEDRAGLLARCRSGHSVLVDVRPFDEFAAGHLPGAIHAPLSDLDTVAKQLPRDREIVAYCRGFYSALAIDAVRKLRARGLTATHLDLGVPELRRLGYPVQTTSS